MVFVPEKGKKVGTLRLGIEPRSTAICLDRGCLLTGGYTDHYTNEDLVVMLQP